MNVGILRLHNVYGPRAIFQKNDHRQEGDSKPDPQSSPLPGRRINVWGSGKQARNFVFVGDVIEALCTFTVARNE